MNQQNGGKENWATRIGVILAVTGSAVGLGNFLRFPGQAAQYGGGVFIIPYVVAFLLLGLPIAWVEWSMGRFGGARGYNSAPGVFRAVCGKPWASYLGMLGPLIPVVIYMYYVFVEAWCLGYAWNYLSGDIQLGDEPEKYDSFFATFVGSGKDGAAFTADGTQALVFLAICFVLNFYLIYRGLNKGIEWFCKFAMPALVLCALVVLGRVLTLGTPNPDLPEQSLVNGLGYMWNPVHQAEHLAPGDKPIKALAQRSTVDAISGFDDSDGYLTFNIEDEPAFAWALEQAEWKPKQARQQQSQDTVGETGPTDQPPLAGRFVHDDSQAVLQINGGRAAFLGLVDNGDALMPHDVRDEAVEMLLTMIPVQAAIADRDERTLRGFDIQDADSFHAALTATGWKGRSDGLEGRFEHKKSRLILEVGARRAEISIPGFLQSLANPEMWLAAAGQIFFSLSVGFGIVITYASYVRRDDDVALSALTAASGNGFCEVALGGLITIPATFVFLGVTAVASPPGTFGMGFVALPSVFNQMGILGPVFGFLFFFLLFLAAITSSLSMLQPAIALFEEGLGIGRKASVAMLGFITFAGAMFIVYFSKDLLALDTVDFWVGNVCIYIMATVQVIIFGWVLGLKRGMEELDRGAEIRLPRFLGFLIKYVSPLYLLTIFALWLKTDLPTRVEAVADVEEGQMPVVALSLGLIAIVLIFFILIINRAVGRWNKQEAAQKEVSP